MPVESAPRITLSMPI